jgi:hypothetical protein
VLVGAAEAASETGYLMVSSAALDAEAVLCA